MIQIISIHMDMDKHTMMPISILLSMKKVFRSGKPFSFEYKKLTLFVDSIDYAYVKGKKSNFFK